MRRDVVWSGDGTDVASAERPLPRQCGPGGAPKHVSSCDAGRRLLEWCASARAARTSDACGGIDRGSGSGDCAARRRRRFAVLEGAVGLDGDGEGGIGPLEVWGMARILIPGVASIAFDDRRMEDRSGGLPAIMIPVLEEVVATMVAAGGGALDLVVRVADLAGVPMVLVSAGCAGGFGDWSATPAFSRLASVGAVAASFVGPASLGAIVRFGGRDVGQGPRISRSLPDVGSHVVEVAP